jgi:AcrR family transcriptional regulator
LTDFWRPEVTTRANSSRERILSTAEAMILERGFAGTTIDDIIDKAAITKGGFFYHFDGKRQLARALVERYTEMDSRAFQEFNERANSLSEDPLQRTLIFLNLFAEMVAGMTQLHPGCLVAAFTYETQQIDDEIRGMMEQTMLEWREMIVERLHQIMEIYTPRMEVDVNALADMFSSTLEGGIILSRVYGDNQALIEQVHAYRSHLRLLFDDIH